MLLMEVPVKKKSVYMKILHKTHFIDSSKLNPVH